ncbi:hypothetical protein DL765_001517 [Monosporascus sp. GIB2]|nr:hypothetical protein DL765_001517 [Monosporascus sp. GIB2]
MHSLQLHPRVPPLRPSAEAEALPVADVARVARPPLIDDIVSRTFSLSEALMSPLLLACRCGRRLRRRHRHRPETAREASSAGGRGSGPGPGPGSPVLRGGPRGGRRTRPVGAGARSSCGKCRRRGWFGLRRRRGGPRSGPAPPGWMRVRGSRPCVAALRAVVDADEGPAHGSWFVLFGGWISGSVAMPSEPPR